jgi:hypothetical protein
LDVVPARGGDFDGAFYVVLAFDFAEIKILVGGTGQSFVDRTGSRTFSPRRNSTTSESHDFRYTR